MPAHGVAEAARARHSLMIPRPSPLLHSSARSALKLRGNPVDNPREAWNNAASQSKEEAVSAENIICFAKDWSEDPTSNNHVMRLLAKQHKVLWLNSISMRAPSLTSGRDVRKIGKKLASFTRGAQRVSDNLWVYTPIVLPFPHSPLAVRVNRWILK